LVTILLTHSNKILLQLALKVPFMAYRSNGKRSIFSCTIAWFNVLELYDRISRTVYFMLKTIYNRKSNALPLVIFGIFLLSIGFERQAFAEKKIALVIGNSDYRDVPLTNPLNDAEDISAALRSTGFEVDTYTNVNRKQMREAIRSFGDKLRQSDIGLFYYAGHGIQIKGRNYLIPLAVDVHASDEVEDESIDAGAVLRKMESAGNDVNIVILDACRNNPFARSFRSLESGLARMDGPVGSFIAYATAPGSVAADGEGRNGVYTAHLLEALRHPGLTIEQIFKQVRVSVKEETSGLQIPWESSSLMGEFVFLPKLKSNETKAISTKLVPPAPPVAIKHLQVIANVPKASVSVNNINRGVIGEEGVLNIANLTADEAEVMVQAEGYASQRQRVRLKDGQWEQLYVTLQPDKKAETEALEAIGSLKAQNSSLSCSAGKRTLLSSKIIFQQGNEKKVRRNAPVFQTKVMQSFRAYGLDFIELEPKVGAVKPIRERKPKPRIRKLGGRHNPQYLLKAVINVWDSPIRLLKTNMRTVNAEITLELLDLASKHVLASTSRTFTKAGIDPRRVAQTQLEHLLPGMSSELISQVCDRV
jgi:caspase domain-containing protein